MASLSSCAGGQDASATELDANLKAAAFPELQRKCTELKIDFEPLLLLFCLLDVVVLHARFPEG